MFGAPKAPPEPVVVGIDPGISGGVSVLTWTGRFITGIRMPSVLMGKRAMVDTVALDALMIGFENVRSVVIEAPNSMPKQGLQSTFNFGRHCGAVEGWAVSLRCPVRLVTPSVWKKFFALSSDKRASLDRARMEFGPDERWTVLANDGIAEAALIALWCVRSGNIRG